MKEITLEASLENIPQATTFIDEELEKVDCSLKARMQIDVAIDELFANIARYAYAPATGAVTLRFDYDASARMASLTFVDAGVPFDPLSRTDPDVTLSVQEREAGGLGIFLVKKTMDAMEYRRADNLNILTIRKRV